MVNNPLPIFKVLWVKRLNMLFIGELLSGADAAS